MCTAFKITTLEVTTPEVTTPEVTTPEVTTLEVTFVDLSYFSPFHYFGVVYVIVFAPMNIWLGLCRRNNKKRKTLWYVVIDIFKLNTICNAVVKRRINTYTYIYTYLSRHEKYFSFKSLLAFLEFAIFRKELEKTKKERTFFWKNKNEEGTKFLLAKERGRNGQFLGR